MRYTSWKSSLHIIYIFRKAWNFYLTLNFDNLSNV